MDAHLTEEGIWELPPLEELLAEGERRWMQNRLSESIRAKKRERAAAEYALYRQAVRRWREGVSYHHIGKEIGKAGTVVRCWIEKGQLPLSLSGIVYRKPKLKRISISPAQEHGVLRDDVLRVLGLMLATTRTHGEYRQRWAYEKSAPDDSDMDYARRALAAAFGAGSFYEKRFRRRERKDNLVARILFQSNSFFEQYNAVTCNSSRMPLEQMPTLEAKLAFAEAFFRESIAIKYEPAAPNTLHNAPSHAPHKKMVPTELHVAKKTTPENTVILEQAAVLLYYLGCYPHLALRQGMSVVSITDPDDILLLFAYGCISDSCGAAAEMIVAGTTGRNICGQHRILQAYDAARLIPDGTASEVIARRQDIAAGYGVSLGRVDNWHRKRSMPHIARRRDCMEQLRKKYFGEPAPHQPHLHAPFPAVLSFLPATQRNEPARQYLAQRYSLEDVQFYACALERAGIAGNERLRWLLLPEEILYARLDRAAPLTMTANGTLYQLGWRALRDYCQMEHFQPYRASGSEWREHLRRIRDCLPEQAALNQISSQTTYHHDEFTFTLARARDRIMVAEIC